jgi:hypothetical protein
MLKHHRDYYVDKHIFKLPAATLRCETCETAALSSVESVAMSASVQI